MLAIRRIARHRSWNSIKKPPCLPLLTRIRVNQRKNTSTIPRKKHDKYTHRSALHTGVICFVRKIRSLSAVHIVKSSRIQISSEYKNENNGRCSFAHVDPKCLDGNSCTILKNPNNLPRSYADICGLHVIVVPRQ